MITPDAIPSDNIASNIWAGSTIAIMAVILDLFMCLAKYPSDTCLFYIQALGDLYR
jgi:hypothetical protein